MSSETASMVHGFHAAAETAVGLGMFGLLNAGQSAAADRAAYEGRLRAASAYGEALGLQEVVRRLRAELAQARSDAAHLRSLVNDLSLDNECLMQLAREAAHH